MKSRLLLAFLPACAAFVAVQCYGQTASGIPHLEKQGAATQLIVDGKPFLALTGELGNNTATSLENMKPIWPKLVAGNLNCVLIAVSWAQMEPAEGKYEFALVDGLIQEARNNNLKVVFLWFGSWKNGLSSYAPYWVKKDYKRFPRIRLQNGSSMELLSTFGDATRDADARAYGALMRHIKDVDSDRHTVVMMQVENEVGVLRDSRDRSAAANKAFAGPVPKELMDYLQRHKDTLNPELREVWAAQGFKTSGSWEEVFGPGKPESFEMPIQTKSPPMSAEEHEISWRKLHWPVDEIFMAWNYARFVNKVVEEGKAGYNIPMPGPELTRAAARCPRSTTCGEPERRRSMCSRRISISSTSTKSPQGSRAMEIRCSFRKPAPLPPTCSRPSASSTPLHSRRSSSRDRPPRTPS